MGVGWLWFRVSHEDAMNLSAGAAVIQGLIWAGRHTSKVIGVAVGAGGLGGSQHGRWLSPSEWSGKKEKQVAALPLMN